MAAAVLGLVFKTGATTAERHGIALVLAAVAVALVLASAMTRGR
jgi:hypothetical protein